MQVYRVIIAAIAVDTASLWGTSGLATRCEDKAWEVKQVTNANGYGLVVMTLASHARGRGFDPLFPYAFFDINFIFLIAFTFSWYHQLGHMWLTLKY